MSRLPLRLMGIVLIAAVAVLPTNVSRGQLRPVPAKDSKAEEPKFTEAVTLPRNPESKRLIQAAQDYVKKQEWRIAGECLQSLLETPEDSFIEVTRKNDHGADVAMRVSVRSEANRIIGELPPDGLESYQVQYGQVAAERLKTAIEAADPAMLAEISQRYFNTKAGQEATNLLGTYQLDRGQHLIASLCFEKLLARPDADKLPTLVLFKAALAYRRAGNTASGEQAFTRFTEKFGREQLTSRSKFTLEQFRAEFDREVGTNLVLTSSDWPVYRGNAARTAQCRGSTAYLEPRWLAHLSRPDETPDVADKPTVLWIEQHLDQAIQLLRDKPIMPAFFPIAAKGKVIVRAYDGIAAYSIKGDPAKRVLAGDLLWRSYPENSQSLFAIVRDDVQGRRHRMQDWYTNSYLANGAGPIGVLFENSVVGSISHDGQRVYYIDDLAVPPHPSMMRGGAFTGVPTNYGPFANEVYYNRLCAADIESGSLVWTAIGGKSAGTTGPPAESRPDLNAGTELQDSFFLGPPLPLGGKLYVLTEKQSELRLVCLDPNKLVQSAANPQNSVPELLWVQSLGTANEKLPLDGLRRMQAAHLAYGDGILVCPTNAGAVVGVDLLSHSLVWAFSYRKAQQQNNMMDEQLFVRRRFGGMPTGPTVGDRWRPSAPCVIRGKVIFTAPDSGDVHCLNLRDGQLMWSAKRDDADLYFAGAFDDRAVIVAKNSVRALNLTDGKEIWKRPETGLPCGQGVAADGVYYLPLASSADPKTADKGPEICAIELKKGEIVGRSKSRQEIPGNLLFLDGELIAQNVKTVASYPLLKVKQEEISIALSKNPYDPIGLTERGELHLYNGAVRDAVTDLRLGLAQNPPAEIKAKARSKLHEALTILIKDDFAGAEQYLPEFAGLCQVDIPVDADIDTRQKLASEQTRRLAAYLELLGRGRERQGRVLEAFAAYEQYGELSGNKELVDSVDEPNTKARPDIWSRGRIQAMIDHASESDRQKLEAEIAKRWQAVRSTDGFDGLRKFTSLYGSISTSGRLARIELAERLLATGDPDDLTEAERSLASLCLGGRDRRDDPMVAGKATELMIRVCLRRGRYENAVGFCRQLAEEFPDVPVRENMTGRQWFEEMRTDKRFLPYLDAPTSIWTGPLSADRQGSNSVIRELSTPLQPRGELLPFFDRHRIVLDTRQDGGPGFPTLRFLDRANGEERWRVNNLPGGSTVGAGQLTSPTVFASGQMLLLQLNEWVVAYDISERKETWRFNLLGKDAQPPGDPNQMRAFDALNNMVAASPDEKKVTIGRVAIAEPGYVAVQGRDGLTALDPTRPGPSRLWVKADVPVKAAVFGDDRHVFIFDRDAPAGRPKCQALRAQDGMPVKCPDFAEAYKKKLHTLGGRILVSEDNGQTLRLFDALTGKETWRKSFAARSVVVKADDERLIGAIEPSGKFTLIDAQTGDIKVTSEIGAERVQKLKTAQVLVDRDRLFLVLHRASDSSLLWNPAMLSGRFMAANEPWMQGRRAAGEMDWGSDGRFAPVNGPIVALNRSSGEFEWASETVAAQALLKEQWADLPVLLCASTFTEHTPSGNMRRQGTHVTAIHKATGKLLFDDDKIPATGPYFALVVNHAKSRIELIRQDSKIVITPAEMSQAGPATKIINENGSRVLPSPVVMPAPIGRPLPVAPPPAPPPPKGM